MKISKAMMIPSLQTAQIAAGRAGLDNEVSGIMVLEALDIERWGRRGEIILTSFFALQHCDDEDMEFFFRKINTIGISAIILKMERLLQMIPEIMVRCCDEFAIPLICIPQDIKYEAIILEILSPIINGHFSLLRRYHETHNLFTSLAMKVPTTLEILQELKKLLALDVTLVNQSRNKVVSTKPELLGGVVLDSWLLPKEQYMKYEYCRSRVQDRRKSQGSSHTQLSVLIPTLNSEVYELIVHETVDLIPDEEFMVVENAVSFLQMDLLKKYALEQDKRHKRNEQINDLINGRIDNREAIDDLLSTLSIDKFKNYRMALIHIHSNDPQGQGDGVWKQAVYHQICAKVKQRWSDTVFLEKESRMILLHNYSGEDSFTPMAVSEILQKVIVSLPNVPAFHYHASVSTTGTRYKIPGINKELLDIWKIMNLFHQPNKALSYDDLGIFTLLLEMPNGDRMLSSIVPHIEEYLAQYPELLETLWVFLDAGQSYQETAKQMFIHPKTVKYRIEKAVEIFGVNLNSADQVLSFQVARRIRHLHQEKYGQQDQ